MEQADYLIIGGGIAGTTAAETIRSKDPTSTITILTDETERLYSRVSLKHFLRNEKPFEDLYLRTKESYAEKNIDLKTSTPVSKVDTTQKTVITKDGQTFSYGKLLIATGGRVNKLGVPGAELPQIAYLRTLDDVKNLKGLIDQSQKALVIGGGFIGIDIAQSFVSNSLETTAIIRDKYFWEEKIGENSGKLLTKILEENGVKILPEKEVKEFEGAGKLEGAKLNDGSLVKTDLAGVGIGIHLNTAFLDGSRLEINTGVVTNQFLETSSPDVWAAGDIAEFFDPIFNKHHVLGNWTNASTQGRTAGLNMTGEKTAFETASSYSINLFNHNFSVLGDPVIEKNTETVERGSLQDGKIARLLIREDVIVGASLIDMTNERNSLSNLIKNRTKITASKNKLQDLSFDLATI